MYVLKYKDITLNGRQGVDNSKMLLKQQGTYYKNMDSLQLPTLYTKITSRWIRDVNTATERLREHIYLGLLKNCKFFQIISEILSSIDIERAVTLIF